MTRAPSIGKDEHDLKSSINKGSLKVVLRYSSSGGELDYSTGIRETAASCACMVPKTYCRLSSPKTRNVCLGVTTMSYVQSDGKKLDHDNK